MWEYTRPWQVLQVCEDVGAWQVAGWVSLQQHLYSQAFHYHLKALKQEEEQQQQQTTQNDLSIAEEQEQEKAHFVDIDPKTELSKTGLLDNSEQDSETKNGDEEKEEETVDQRGKVASRVSDDSLIAATISIAEFYLKYVEIYIFNENFILTDTVW